MHCVPCCSQALIDPVCFLTCYPHLLYSFVYKVPKAAEVLSSAAGLFNAARFLFSRDLIIAEVRLADMSDSSSPEVKCSCH